MGVLWKKNYPPVRGFYPELFCQLKGLGTDASADGHDFLWVCHAALWCDLQNIGLHGHGSSEQGSWCPTQFLQGTAKAR